MPKKPDWEKIRQEWESSNITLKALAEKYGVKLGTLKSRKSREKWSKDATKKDATGAQVATLKKTNKEPPKEPNIKNNQLTEKQRFFCLYYIKNFNATQAAIKAGYVADSAHVTGSQLLRNPKVAKEIRRLKGQLQEEIFIDALDVLNRYIKIAFADMTDFVEFGQEEIPIMTIDGPAKDKDGNLITRRINVIRFKDSSQVDGGLICQIKQGRDGTTIKLEDRQKALDKLAQYFDLFPDKFQRRIEEEKLKVAQQKLEIEKKKAEVDGEGTQTIVNIIPLERKDNG